MHFRKILLTCMVAGALHVHAATTDLVIATNGASRYVIAYAADADEGKITEAANLLQMLVAEGTGAELPIFKESDAPTNGPVIYLGRSRAARAAGLPVDEVEGWSYLNRVVGKNIYLAGEDIDGDEGHGGFSGYAGTLKAVTAFLESQAGVRFVLPGPMGVHVPQRAALTVDAALNVSWSPRFQFVIGRRVSPWGGDYDYDPYAIANNYFGRYSGDTRVFCALGSHSYPDFVPHEAYFETHPEYFFLFKGKRAHWGRRNLLCISNPEVQELLLRGMEEKLDQGFQMVMLGQSDGYIECRCPRCQAIHPDMGEKLWIVHRKLAEEMQRRRPGKQVVLMAYVSTIKPPQTFDTFPDNVVILNNRYIPEFFEAWERFDTPRIVYFPEWLRTWPHIPPRMAVNRIRLWLENGVIGIYLGGGLDSGNSPWGLNGPAYYAFGKAMADPARDADELEREYVDASFGAAAAPMREFFAIMHRRMEVRERFDRLGTGVPDRNYRGYPFTMLPGDFVCHFFAPEILNQMNAQLGKAAELAETPETRARLELVAAEFRFLDAVARLQHVYRAYQAAPSMELVNALEERVAHRAEVVRTWLNPNGTYREPGGRRQLRSPYGMGPPVKAEVFAEVPDQAPYNWDFNAIRKSGVLPVPEIEIRVRGGQELPPYEVDDGEGVEKSGDGLADEVPADDGFEDAAINAPFDQ